MNEQNTATDDDMPSVQFILRNPAGEDGTLELRQAYLGMDLYILVQAGEEGPTVESSHLDFDNLALTLAFLLETAIQSDSVSDDTRATVRAMLAGQ